MTSSGGKWRYPKQAATPGKFCKDCLAETVNNPRGARQRPAPHPGPRCHTHHNAKKRNARLAAKIRHVEVNYDLTDAEYNELYEYQGGKCALCPRTGASKRLAVDHDHYVAATHDHPPDKGCKKCVRGLLCSTCNDIMAHFRDSPEAFERGAAYLRMWPIVRLRAKRPPWRSDV